MTGEANSLPSPALTAESSGDPPDVQILVARNARDCVSQPTYQPLPPPLDPQSHTGGESFNSPSVTVSQFVAEKLRTPNLPPILFRTYNDGTRGENDRETGFKSERMKHTGTRAVLNEMTRDEFEESVVHHINNVMYFEVPVQSSTGRRRNKKKNAKLKRVSMQSIWLSTSSSLLTTLQRARWMVYKGFRNITIAAIDVSSLRKPEYAKNVEFICAVPELCQFLGHEETRRHVQFNSNEEYLVLNQIQCKISHIPFTQMYEAGISALLPSLEQKNVREFVGEGLVALRRATFGRIFPLTEDEVKICKKITRSFFKGQRCNLVFYALLALKRRPPNDPAIDGIVKSEMRTWRDNAAFHSNGLVRADNIFYFRYEFDFSRPHQSNHEEIVQFAALGQRLTKHNREYEEVIGQQIMDKIWDEYGAAIRQMDERSHSDPTVKILCKQLAATKRDINRMTFKKLCADEKSRRNVIGGLKLLRKWKADMEKNGNASAAITKARLERQDRKAAVAW